MLSEKRLFNRPPSTGARCNGVEAMQGVYLSVFAGVICVCVQPALEKAPKLALFFSQEDYSSFPQENIKKNPKPPQNPPPPPIPPLCFVFWLTVYSHSAEC